MDEIEIMVTISSEKTSASCGGGISCPVGSDINKQLKERLFDLEECLAESFWEFADEFERAIFSAKENQANFAAKDDEAEIDMESVFGHFLVTVEVNGEEYSGATLDLDADDFMYSLLSQL